MIDTALLVGVGRRPVGGTEGTVLHSADRAAYEYVTIWKSHK